MFSGIGIAVTLVTVISQNRVHHMQQRLKSKTEGKSRVLANETKTTMKDKIEGIENLSEEDFDGLVIMMKSLRHTLLEESKNVYKCPRCGNDYYSKPKYCSNCGLAVKFVQPIWMTVLLLKMQRVMMICWMHSG